ncbi:MAG TPA: hypothetical protein VEM39_00700 [Myxococcaceae bacterium]|nr:hypothetical protein [Myxococcaceae bacterium]
MTSAIGQGRAWHQHLGAERHRAAELRRNVVNLDEQLHRRVPRRWRRPDPTVDATRFARAQLAIPQRVARVDRPIEQVLVKGSDGTAVARDDLRARWRP